MKNRILLFICSLALTILFSFCGGGQTRVSGDYVDSSQADGGSVGPEELFPPGEETQPPVGPVEETIKEICETEGPKVKPCHDCVLAVRNIPDKKSLWILKMEPFKMLVQDVAEKGDDTKDEVEDYFKNQLGMSELPKEVCWACVDRMRSFEKSYEELRGTAVYTHGDADVQEEDDVDGTWEGARAGHLSAHNLGMAGSDYQINTSVPDELYQELDYDFADKIRENNAIMRDPIGGICYENLFAVKADQSAWDKLQGKLKSHDTVSGWSIMKVPPENAPNFLFKYKDGMLLLATEGAVGTGLMDMNRDACPLKAIWDTIPNATIRAITTMPSRKAEYKRRISSGSYGASRLTMGIGGIGGLPIGGLFGNDGVLALAMGLGKKKLLLNVQYFSALSFEEAEEDGKINPAVKFHIGVRSNNELGKMIRQTIEDGLSGAPRPGIEAQEEEIPGEEGDGVPAEEETTG